MQGKVEASGVFGGCWEAVLETWEVACREDAQSPASPLARQQSGDEPEAAAAPSTSQSPQPSSAPQEPGDLRTPLTPLPTDFTCHTVLCCITTMTAGYVGNLC